MIISNSWAFASAEALSDRFCVQAVAANLSLSVEYLMDCNVVNNGCAGGLLDDSWRFMAATGLPTESCVPYQEEEGPLLWTRRHLHSSTTCSL